MPAEAVIQVKNLRKEFKELTAVADISFEVKAGSCFGLLGPNGAGKTTTIEMLEGITKPSAGEILYYGNTINKQALESVGIQFQHTALQDFLTTKEALELFAAFYPNALPVEQLIEQCDLTEFVDRDHRKLSGGQKQRLLLAIALINDPKVLFLDEPTTGLDPHARRNFWDLINSIKQQNKTILLTTHYMDEAEYLCDEIAIMDKGKIIEQGAPSQLLQQHFSGGLLRLPQSALSTVDGTHFNWQQHEGLLQLETDNVEQTIKSLMEQQVPLDGLQVKSANLDDLFLKLTGHKLAAENGGNNV